MRAGGTVRRVVPPAALRAVGDLVAVTGVPAAAAPAADIPAAGEAAAAAPRAALPGAAAAAAGRAVVAVCSAITTASTARRAVGAAVADMAPAEDIMAPPVARRAAPSTTLLWIAASPLSNFPLIPRSQLRLRRLRPLVTKLLPRMLPSVTLMACSPWKSQPTPRSL